MASVRMTNILRQEIRQAAWNAYDTANPEPKPHTDFVQKARIAIENSPEQKFLNDMYEEGVRRGLTDDNRKGGRVVPVTPSDKPTQVELRDYHGRNDSRREYGEVTIHFNTPLANWKKISEGSYSWGNPTIALQDLSPQDQAELGPLHEAHLNDIFEHRNKAQQYRHSIDQLLESVTTVKQLLEVWPGAESLIPSEAMQKMHVKVTRKQKVETIKEKISFDPTVANQAVLTSKMLGG